MRLAAMLKEDAMFCPKHLLVDTRTGTVLAAGTRGEMHKLKKQWPMWEKFVGYSDKKVGDHYGRSQFYLDRLNGAAA